MSKWYIDKTMMVNLDDVTCIEVDESVIRGWNIKIYHGLKRNDNESADYIRRDSETEIYEVYEKIQEILTKPLDGPTKA